MTEERLVQLIEEWYGGDLEASLYGKEALVRLGRTIAAEVHKYVTVTTNEQGEVVVVSQQDEEGRILKVIWERAPEQR